jgi:hypothetical protein
VPGSGALQAAYLEVAKVTPFTQAFTRTFLCRTPSVKVDDWVKSGSKRARKCVVLSQASCVSCSQGLCLF